MTRPTDHERDLFYTRPDRDISFTLEEPQFTTSVTMPDITEKGVAIPTTIHTDGMGQIVRFFDTYLSPEIQEQLVMEGRYFATSHNMRALNDNPIHEYYTRRRNFRLPNADPETLPRGLRDNPNAARELAFATFSPASLTAETGHQVAFYSVPDLITQNRRKVEPINRYIAILSGCNQFRLGSNTLTGEVLKDIGDGMNRYMNGERDTFLLTQNAARISSTTGLPPTSRRV